MEYRFIEQTDIVALAALRLDYLRETTRRDIPAEFLSNTLHYLETGFAEGALVGMVAVESGTIVAHGMIVHYARQSILCGGVVVCAFARAKVRNL